jgi:hypothetical protein
LKIIYLGAEVPSNRTLLETTTANHVGVSYWRLVKRGLPKTKAYLIDNYFSSDTHVYVHAGIPKAEKLTASELEDFAVGYEEFVANNIDRLTTFNEVTHPLLSPAFIAEQRRTCWSEVPPSKFQPIWQSQTGSEGLRSMVDSYLDIGISGEDIEYETQLAALTKTFTNRNGTRFHAINTAKPDNMRQVKVESASSLSWLAPMLHGETIIWNGTKLVRYPKKMKEQARPRYKAIYDKAGLSFDLIMEDDPQEVCKLAVWSFEQLEVRLNTMNGNSDDSLLYDNSDDMYGDSEAESTPVVSDNKGGYMRKVEPRNPDEIGNLPVFGYSYKSIVEQDEEGHDVIKDVPVVQSQDTSLRQCDTCFVAANCPAFKPQSMCAFKLPVEVKTKDQLKSLINAIIEIQGQRVAFMRFAEEMNGGYADPNVSQEIDRLFKLIKTTKELDDSREFIRMTVERQGASGVLSSIFGDRAQALKELPDNGLTEVQTTRIISDSLEDK